MAATTAFPTARTEIAGQTIADLVGQYGTPLYVYDQNVIDQRIEQLKSFDVIRYAQKACSNIAILERMRRRGVVVDAVSAGEIHRAMKAGYQGGPGSHEIVYTADIFDRQALEMCVDHRLHVNCGSPDMISQIGSRLPGCEITLRINPGFGHGHSQKTNTGGDGSKHGIWHSQINDCLLRADQNGVTVTGLHMHIGSGTDLEHLGQVGAAMESAAHEVGRTLKTISAGGGLPVPYKDDESYVDIEKYFQIWDDTRNRLSESFGHRLQLEIEPGRFLSAESGYLIAEVRAVKKVGDNLFVLVDAGFNDLARPVMYGAYHPISVCSIKGNAAAREEVPTIVGGPLCESGDIFTQREGGYVESRMLPTVGVGDYLILENAGAYGFVMASNYNSKLRPAEVLIEDGSAKLIRQRETMDDLTRGEIIPD
ncbi:diaminopimelate decarboxylase [Crateriforma conspicua]|uniref:Diaminopimelate decarboxylase n=2 Tax=Crateriforma conspicua TaxID=2527996 RepID=A0A5C5Y2G4_9PLAN|nr:diaminopimelate decarboxylase [Crateriforma conspicua]QDV62811.1 Diaminopimelate decarboxylase [Crateriforma conspicua]TWT68425.1 Diaminopimelate decarboxylase [Crateriforma conspicua]